MSRTVLAALCVSATMTGALWAQDSLDIDVEAFTGINAAGAYRVEIVAGDTPSVRLAGDSDNFDDINIRVRNGRLDITQDWGLLARRRALDVVVHVTVNDVDSLDFNRGVNATASGIDADRLHVKVNTGAVARLSGNCTRLELEMATGGTLDAAELFCQDVAAEGSTGATASVHASNRIEARAIMGAELRVHGAPEHRDTETSMGGTIRLVGEG